VDGVKGGKSDRDGGLGTACFALVDSEEHSQEWLCYWAARRQVRWRGSELRWPIRRPAGLRRRQVARKIGERFAESSKQTRPKYRYQNTTPGGLLSSRIYPYAINVRTSLKNPNSRSEAQEPKSARWRPEWCGA
jgi:hypothetical protein